MTARNLVAARALIECATETEVIELHELLLRHEQAESLADRIETDLQYHQAIADMSGNPVLCVIFGAIKPFTADIMFRSHSDPRVHAVGDPLHGEIFECISVGDADGAEAAMRSHLELALQLYGHDVDRPRSEVVRNRESLLEN